MNNNNLRIGFGIYSKELETFDAILGNQSVFNNKIYEILQDDIDMSTLLSHWENVINNENLRGNKILFFELIKEKERFNILRIIEPV